MRPIDADELLKKKREMELCFAVTVWDIEGAPTIDPESLRPTGEWVSVEERLPQEGGSVCENVILLMDNGLVTVGWLNQITNRGYYLDTINDVVIKAPLSRFTHWMPLPEPPNCGAKMKGESDG